MGVDIGGYAEVTGEGRTLHIKQTLRGYQIENFVMDTTSDRAKAQAAIEAEVPEWINAAFIELRLEAGSGPVYAYAMAGGYEGSANLLPVR